MYSGHSAVEDLLYNIMYSKKVNYCNASFLVAYNIYFF